MMIRGSYLVTHFVRSPTPSGAARLAEQAQKNISRGFRIALQGDIDRPMKAQSAVVDIDLGHRARVRSKFRRRTYGPLRTRCR
jgi:hypothetical protein